MKSRFASGKNITMANEIFDLRFALRMAPVIPLGHKPIKFADFDPVNSPLAHRILKSDEVETIATALEKDLMNGNPIHSIAKAYRSLELRPPQYRGAILSALNELRSNQAVNQIFTHVIDENTPVMDIIRINSERIKTYPGGSKLFIDAFLPYSADLPDSQMIPAQKANASNAFVWYTCVFYPIGMGVAELVDEQCLTLNQVSIELRKSLDTLIPKPDFDFSRFGQWDEMAKPYHLQAIEKAINEEILFPNRFTGKALNFLVGKPVEITTPANRKIIFFEKDCPFQSSLNTSSSSSHYYFRRSTFEQTALASFEHSKKSSNAYQSDRSLFLKDNLSVRSYIRAKMFLQFSKEGDALNALRDVFRKMDEDVYLSISDLEQATESMLGRRVYDSCDDDSMFQLKTFFKKPYPNTSDICTNSKVAQEFIRARSALMSIKNSDFPLIALDDIVSPVYNSGRLEYGYGVRLAVELLLVNMEEEGLLNAFYQSDSNEFVRIFKERIVGDDPDEDTRKVDQFNALLKDAASDVLDQFTYENLDHVPRIPENWRDMKLDWKPVEA